MNNKILSIFMLKNSLSRQKNHANNSSLHVGACRDTPPYDIIPTTKIMIDDND